MARHVQLKASWPLTDQLAHTAPSQIYSRGQSTDRDRPALFSAKGRFWRKAALYTQAASRFPALNLPRARAECSATNLDFAAGDRGCALQARFRVETSQEISERLIRETAAIPADSAPALDYFWSVCGEFYFHSFQDGLRTVIWWRTPTIRTCDLCLRRATIDPHGTWLGPIMIGH